ncbi:MAG: aminotransferase class IV [Bacteroidetes bacterium]|nr:aminotransferase class IV [Bacteroidota bacterium]
MNESFVLLNGELIPTANAALAVSDLAIQRGYGIFDFFKTLNQRPIFLNDHLDRFIASAQQLRLPIGKTREELHELIHRLQQANNIPDSGIRLTLTGGYSPDGYALTPASAGGPNLIITQQPLPSAITPDLQRSIRLVTYAHQRQMPETKTIDYLMAIWLQPFIKETCADDVLYHTGGVITECPRSNFFVVTKDNTIVTPGRQVLKGITRMKTLNIAAQQFTIEERDLKLDELKTAKEAFITSTTKHLVPVVQIDTTLIGKGLPGEVTRLLHRELYELVMEEAAR